MKGLEHGRWDRAWGGIASLSLALSIVHANASKRSYTLDDLVRWLCEAPATLAAFDNRAGALLPGREANFLLFDPEATYTVSTDAFNLALRW
jgi:allantoinase